MSTEGAFPEVRSLTSHGYTVITAAISAIAGMLFGYDTGVISGAILFIRDRFHLRALPEELVVSAVLAGAVAGAALGGWLADAAGRRRVLIGAAVVFALAALFTALAPSVPWLVAGRIAVGLAIGVASFTAPLYISEMAPADIRGALVSLNQLALTVGIVTAYLVDFAFAPHGAWRWMFGSAVVPALALLVGMLGLPETPRWLLMRAREGPAAAVLRRIYGRADVRAEVDAIRQDLQQEAARPEELWSPDLRPAVVVGAGLAILQQVTGINTVIYYAPTIFEFAGFHSAAVSILATVGVGLVNVLMTVAAIGLLDRAGRRPLLLAGVAGMVASLAVLGLAFHLPAASRSLGWLTVAGLMVYVGSFAISLGPVFWLLIAEIYPLRIRGRAMSFATLLNWLANLVVALTFLSLVQALGRGNTFWLYALIGVGTWVFAYRLVPETKDKSLEQIQAQWAARRGR
ncbi:Putative metabolite transport protein YwtG [Candidatus Hydrogenisulfobacillus filiaventi]|uniref:Metabolite transport protein YwtG n=1 Tax=Candidatus Hydrogenisulfobacillus filiaventi TaxID=2707344 RepID=A0A6F8ZE65_9FIRM|nr:sugar porter family MFS transporter [Bacillota bacterium]CAB1128296.1 Putative metabolite transport protein YwtG [Candidatus Hydrogenisulfobacillus filiaventi]